MKLTWCSFAGDVFLGAVILDGHLDPISASLTCHMLGVNPGGQLCAIPIPEDVAARRPEYSANRNRLLSKADIDELMGDGISLREATEQGLVLDPPENDQ